MSFFLFNNTLSTFMLILTSALEIFADKTPSGSLMGNQSGTSSASDGRLHHWATFKFILAIVTSLEDNE